MYTNIGQTKETRTFIKHTQAHSHEAHKRGRPTDNRTHRLLFGWFRSLEIFGLNP